MWSGPSQDPGGSTGPPNTQELNDLKDQFEQQQLLIAQLKEMLRKNEQTTVTQEKVEEYANTLTKMKARAKRGPRKESAKDSNTKRVETPASEKINLLRQQLEENRAKFAERGKNQKGIEDMVTQLKAQLDDSQNLMSQTPLNISFAEAKQESYSADSTAQELYSILVNKERRISEMASKIQKLEANVLDLQENLKEKDSVIDARTKAITLMSENLSKKGKSTLDALDDTKLQMRKMQENFVELEQQMKEENQRLLSELQQKDVEIGSLRQKNIYLEELQVDLSTRNSELQERLNNEGGLLQKDVVDKSLDASKDILSLQERIKELETLNATLEGTKHSKIKEEDVHNIEKLVEQLQDSNNKCEEFKIKLENLEKELMDKQLEITDYISTVSNLQKTIKDMTDNKASSMTESKSINLDIKLENEEITKLKKQMDDSNKNMIKVKAQHKGKVKELNKKIDTFKKMGDTNVEVLKLHDENSKLNQRVAELEEEKGALQLKIMETDSTKDSTSVELVNELEKRVSDQASLLTEKENEINKLTKRLEETTIEIEDLGEKLNKLSHLQNVQVKSEITSIQLEEQMDKLELQKQEITKEKEDILLENVSLTEKVELLKKEKQEILVKLDSYMQENMDLVDKLEKLSAEKVSSAESIEIVEGLTQQEKLELEEYQKSTNITSDTKTSNEHLEENPELNESVNQLTEETSELLQKIELFTVERREVMEKMEYLTQENNQLNLKIKEIENNRDVLAETYEQLQNEKEQLDNNLETLKNQNDNFEDKIKMLEGENETLKSKVNENDNCSSENDGRTMNDLLMEIEEYKSLIEIQREEIKELKVHLMGQEFITNDKLELEAKVNSLQLQYENILTENETLMSKIKEQAGDVHQKEDIEKDLIATRKRLTEFEEKISDNLNEIENYKTILEENKSELISSANLITELQTSISAMRNEVVHYNEEVAHLNSVILDLNIAIDHLEKENKEKSSDVANINDMSHQLEELKQSLTENIEQINEYQEEIENNSKTIIDLQKEIKSLNIKILDTEHLLESKNDELNIVKREKEEKDVQIGILHEQVRIKDGKFQNTVKDFTEKYYVLQEHLVQNTGAIDNIREPLENKIKELETKNKEQLDKMKIIAANLKKKTLALQNLERKYTEANEKWETEQKEKETLIEVADKNVLLENEVVTLNEKFANQSAENQKLKEEIFDHKQRFNSLENMNTKLSEETLMFSLNVEDAQNTISELERRIFELNSENELLKADIHNNFNSEVNEKDEIIRNLKLQLEDLQYSSQTNSNALQMKIQELEMFIETQDTDLTQYKDRVNKLEEGLSSMEDRRMSLERTAIELGAQLREKTDECEEVTQTEDILEKRLNALISHDEIIEKKLQDITYENDELNKNLKAVITENDQLNEKLRETKDILNTTQNDKEALETLENEIGTLRKFVNTLENDKRNMKNEYEQKLFATKEYIEKMDIEIQSQLEIFDKDRRHFGEEKEKMTDQIKEYVELHESLSEELSSYKERLDKNQKIILNGGQQYDKLQFELQQTVHSMNELKEINKNNENTILKLNEEASRVFTEIETLKKDLQLKSTELEQYQNQISQIQTPISQSGENQFNFDTAFHGGNDLQNLRQVNDDLHEQIKVLELENENISRSLTETQQNLEDFKRQTAFKDEPLKSEELKSLKAQYNSLEMNYGKLSEENSLLRNQIAKLNEELQKSLSTVSTGEASGGVTTFTWPDDENTATQSQMFSLGAAPTENTDSTKDELFKKMHFLECVIQKLEKEKNDALAECHTLSGEVAKLLYYQSAQERSSRTIDPPESQPLQSHDVNLDLESQIMLPEAINITPGDLSQLHTYEYAPTKEVIDQGASLQPVLEEMIQPSTSYLCYNPEDSEATKSFDTFEDNDDGWGWGPEEAKLEQEHYDKISAPPQSEQFKRQINILEEKIRVLEQARERHSEEIKQSQTKSGKLIKKLKEFRTKNEELATQLNKKSDGFDDLNDAIQDELKSQIKNLEKKIKDVNGDLEKEKLEKNNLLKRVDTLTAGHERLIENKEKQDVEIMSWQQRCRELNTKLEQFEWGDDSPKRTQKTEMAESSEIDSKRVEELTYQIKELTLDNEELQTLLEEQRNLRLTAEKAKPTEPIAINMKTEEEFLVVLNEKDFLQRELNQSNEEKIKLKNEYLSLSNEKDSLQGELNLVNEERTRMQNEYLSLSSEKDSLQKDLFSLNENKTIIEEELYKLSQINGDLQQNLQQLFGEKQHLQEDIKIIYETQRKEDFTGQINQFNLEKQKLIDDNTKNNETIVELRSKLDNYDAVISNERQQYEELNKTLDSLNNQINTLSIENNGLQDEKSNLENEKHQCLAEINLKDLERNDLQNVITDLNTKISNIHEEMLSMQDINKESVEVNEKLREKEEELAVLRKKLLDQEKEYEFKVSATIQQLTDEWSEKVDQRGYDIAESWKLHLESRENEFLQIEDQLKKEINELDEKYTTLVNENNELRKNVDTEIRNEIDKISALQQQINERQHYINDLTKLVQDQQSEMENQKREIGILNTSISELTGQIENKDTEINNLRVLINEKDNVITELKERINALEMESQIISQLKIEIENMKQVLMNKDTQIQDMENKFKQYTQQLEEMRKLYENVKTEKYENVNVIDDISKKLQTSLSQESINADKINTLQQQNNDYQQQLASCGMQLQQQYLQIEALNNEMLKYSTLNEDLAQKQGEINTLSNLLQEKEREYSISSDMKDQENMTTIKEQSLELENFRRTLISSENQYEEALSSKDIDIESIRIQLEQLNKTNEQLFAEKDEFIHVQTELAIKSGEVEEMKNKIEEQNLLLDEESKQLSELREIIQDQVLKIEDLQKELYEKSIHIDGLIAEVDLTYKSGKGKSLKQVKFSDQVETRNIPSSSDDDFGEPANRAELDLALYMLHQRDVRCEELTVELMQLLEERDTLQLKLSNALREKELLRRKCPEEVPTESSSSDTLASISTPSTSDTDIKQQTTDASTSEKGDHLVSKLSELRTVGYHKDKTIVDEQELRRLQQFSIMQQHRDEASKLPPEAAARLVDASYTLSRDVQSPSKVLLDWLWGRSTPKVNNI